MNKGYFIVFEGNEGAGKTTQVAILKQALEKKGYGVIATREPGGTTIGEKIRTITHDPTNTDLDPVAEAYLMAASRAQHVREVISPALLKGDIVISDRFVDSSIVYQGFGRALGEDTIREINTLAVDGAKPDIIFLLRITPEDGQARLTINGKRRDRLDMQQMDFYSRVDSGYLALAKKQPNRYVVIDATKTIEEVASSIWHEVEKRIPPVR